MGDAAVTEVEPRTLDAHGLQLQILGPLRVWQGDREVEHGPRQQSLLLALLLADYGRPVSIGALIQAMWSGDAPSSAVNIVHKYVGSLRRILEPDLDVRAEGRFLHRRGASYALSVDESHLDLALFRALVTEAHARRRESRARESLDSYLRALQQWSGPAATGLEGGAGAEAAFAALNAEFLSACNAAAALAIETGDGERVLPHLRLATEMFPLHEPSHTSLLRVLAAMGERAEALIVFDTIRRRLAEELGLEPGPTLAGAHLDVLRSGSGRDAARATRPDPLDGERAVGAEPHRVVDFSGRTEEIAAIRRFVDGSSATETHLRVLVISGPPGVGKTTTALEALSAMNRARVFVDLHGFDPAPLRPVEVLRTLLAQVHRGEDPPGSLDEAAAAWSEATKGRRLVVVLDNAATEAQVRPVLAADPQTVVVVTSRRTLAGVEAAVRLPLDPFQRPDSIQMLERLISRERADPSDLDELAQLCGDLPLALRIAGARVASRPSWALADYIGRLRNESERLSQLEAGDLAVERTFSLSYAAMPAASRKTFRSLALLNGRTFSARIVAAIDGMSTIECRDRLDGLVDLGMLEVTRGDRYRLHDLLRLYATDRLHAETPAVDIARQRRRLHRWILDTTARAARAFPSIWASVVLPNPRTEEEMANAKAWLMDESDHWYGALKDAVADHDHRIVVDATMALMRISNDWWNWGDWAEVHLLGAAAAQSLGDDEAVAAQLAAAASAIIGDSPDDADAGEAAARRSLAAAKRSRDPQWASWSRIVFASSHMARADWAAALAETTRAAAEFAQRGDLGGELEAHSWSLTILRRSGDERAMGEAERLVAVIDDLGPHPEQKVVSVTVFNVLLAATVIMMNAGRFDDALSLTDRILRLPKPSFEQGSYAAQGMKQRGLALVQLGRFEEATEALEYALHDGSPYLPEGWWAPIEDALAIARQRGEDARQSLPSPPGDGGAPPPPA